MKLSGLNTLLVQRIESALGIPLAAHTQLAKAGRGRAIPPASAASTVPANESSTAKLAFAQTIVAKQPGQANAPARYLTHIMRPPAPTSIKLASADVAQSALETQSAKTHLSTVGRTLLPLIDGFPHGAGPVTQAQPLFVTAVLSLRAQAVATAVVEPEVQTQASKPPANQTPAPFIMPASIDNAAEASFLKPLSSALTQALMVVLKGQIVQSGLFYESHLLEQLQAGSTHLTPLEDEPQHRHPLPEADDLEVREELRPLVRQQLDLLAGQPIQWQGQVWPGATMRWEIFVPPTERDDKTQRQEPDTEERTCRTRIDLDLPTLGAVSARIRIAGPHVDIHLDVTDEGAILAERLSTLRETLESAGMRPGDITLKRVDHDDA